MLISLTTVLSLDIAPLQSESYNSPHCTVSCRRIRIREFSGANRSVVWWGLPLKRR